MFIRKHKIKHADGSVFTQIQIVEGYRPAKGAAPKQRIIKDYGYLERQEDPEAFLRAVKQEVEELNAKGKVIQISIDPNLRINDPINRDLCYGPLFVERIYEQLKIRDFIKAHRKGKAEYDLDAILRYLVAMRIMAPDSKRASYMDIEHIYMAKKTFNLSQIYRALDEICDLRYELQQHLREQLERHFKIDKQYFYLDATNFYFEKDYAEEGKLPQRGVSKEHRTEPIVQMGLILDSNGFPLIHDCFPGNTSDNLLLQPMVEEARKQRMTGERFVVVADKGLNSSKNIDYLCNQGNGYVFSQILRGKKGQRYHERLFDDNAYTTNADGTYKWQMFEEEYTGRDSEGKEVIRKRKVLIFWQAAEAEMAKRKREEKIKRTQKSLHNNAYGIDHGKNEYLTAIEVEKETGEIVDTHTVYSLNEEKIREEERFDGFFCLVTSEMDYDEKKIRQVYHNLWMIEHTYRIEKHDLDLRPVYVRNDKHVRAHAMIVHLAALLIRLMQWPMGAHPLSAERIQRVLNHCTLDILGSGILHLHEVSQKLQFESYEDAWGRSCCTFRESGKDEVFEDFQRLCHVFSLRLDYAYMKQEDFNSSLRRAALPLQ